MDVLCGVIISYIKRKTDDITKFKDMTSITSNQSSDRGLNQSSDKGGLSLSFYLCLTLAGRV